MIQAAVWRISCRGKIEGAGDSVRGYYNCDKWSDVGCVLKEGLKGPMDQTIAEVKRNQG